MLENIKSILGIELVEVNFQKLFLNVFDKNLNGLKIAQISDLHINKWNKGLIEETIDKVNSLKPDIITITGDIICNGKKFIPDLVFLFKQLKSKYGIYACLGNHDHSDGEDGKRVIKAYNDSDIRILVNESEVLQLDGGKIQVAGADDFELGDQNIEKMTSNLVDEMTSLFLVHNPVNFRSFTPYNPALVLSGHTHGGQFYWSFLHNVYKSLCGEFLSGLYYYENSALYVNRGIGTAMFSPVILNKKVYIKTPRINSKPEITFFTLFSKE